MKYKKGGGLTMANLTKKDERKSTEFKIGMCHGKTLSKDDTREYNIRNKLFQIGKLRLVKSRREQIDIRLVAYEMPTKEKSERASRANCVDLFGYDEEHKPYIIELKIKTNKDKMAERIFKEELDSYAEKFKKVRRKIKLAIQEAYFLEKFTFKGDVQKILLAPWEFYASRIAKGKWEDWHLIKEKMTEEKEFYACYYRKEPNPEKRKEHFKIHILKKSTLKKKKKKRV